MIVTSTIGGGRLGYVVTRQVLTFVLQQSFNDNIFTTGFVLLFVLLGEGTKSNSVLKKTI